MNIEHLIYQKINNVLKFFTEKKYEIKNTTNFIEDLEFDEIDILQIVMDIEDDLNILINDEEIAKIITVEDLLLCVKDKITNGNDTA